MSDYSISLVPRQSTYLNPEAKTTEILKWLVAIDVVKPTISDCILGSEGGYAVSEGAKLIVANPTRLPFNLRNNGLEISTNRSVFDARGNGLDELICPLCVKDISGFAYEFLAPWATGKTDSITCPQCGIGSDIHSFEFIPTWGFSNLGFTFWSWPQFTDAFLTDFEYRLGCQVDVVCQHL
ncbi:hypothetical protein J0X19_00160 [Hymenobacter sp. BT186]|uniref:Sugar ABC transporter ATPase n=1 Tax=Hymenobacter telluris TaxID=2816474 RepID=A0A939ERX1_9BACT|nr:hypothetical protein [Hymenobacter telluris]MBO0356343.1 hypothetical protein [Hymenobacter telluris]MBW3372367.1 hypothetical protein [Hymenobacter norwichensis]